MLHRTGDLAGWRADVCPVETASEGKGSRGRAWGMSEQVGVTWGLVEGNWRRGAFPSPLPCHEVLCLLPPCWIPVSSPGKGVRLCRWAGPLWLQASVSPSGKWAEWDWSLLLLGSPSANSCLDARLVMDGASLSGFSIFLFSAKLAQTAALLETGWLMKVD